MPHSSRAASRNKLLVCPLPGTQQGVAGEDEGVAGACEEVEGECRTVVGRGEGTGGREALEFSLDGSLHFPPSRCWGPEPGPADI